MTDTSLLRAALDRAVRGPLDPTGCRTEIGLCFPSMVADLSGGIWADPEPGDELGAWLLGEAADPDEHVIRLVHPHDRARRLLRLPADVNLGDAIDLGEVRRRLLKGGTQ